MCVTKALSGDVALARFDENLLIRRLKRSVVLELKLIQVLACHLGIHNLERLVRAKGDKLVEALRHVFLKLTCGVVDLCELIVKMAQHHDLSHVFGFMEVIWLHIVDARELIYLGDRFEVVRVATDRCHEITGGESLLALLYAGDPCVKLVLEDEPALTILQLVFDFLFVLAGG